MACRARDLQPIRAAGHGTALAAQYQRVQHARADERRTARVLKREERMLRILRQRERNGEEE